MSKSYIIKLVKSARDKQNNRTIWEMFFVLEQLLIGGKNRRIVTAAIIKRLYMAIVFYLPSPYRPKGIINSVEQWFGESIPPQMEGSWIKDIIPESTVYLKKPNHIYNDIHPSFSAYGKSIAYPKAYLSFFKNARVVNENGTIISYDGKVFADFTYEWNKPIEEYEVFKSYIHKPQVRKECLATIAFYGSSGYFHWIFDSLPRLKLLEDVIDKIDYLIVPYNLKRFHLETLNLSGFPEEKLLKVKDGTHLLCENLYVPSLLCRPKLASDFLRENFTPEDVAEPHRLIYISRKDALYRKIINEKEVEDYLREIGFEIVQMSELSLLESVKVCAEARIVIAPHGANLSNTVFCKNAKILEIFSPSYIDKAYWIIANHVGNEYYYLLGEDEPGNSPPQWRNFEIDMETFKETLDRMMEDI